MGVEVEILMEVLAGTTKLLRWCPIRRRLPTARDLSRHEASRPLSLPPARVSTHGE